MCKPCIKCGATDRYKGGDCRPCTLARQAAKKEERREVSRTWTAKNREHVRAKRAEHYRKNKEHERETNRIWLAAHPGVHRAYHVKRYTADPKKQVRRAVEYAKKNRLKVCARMQRWRAENPELVRVHHANRRKRIGDSKLSTNIVVKLYKLQRGLCACCSRPLNGRYHLDHIMPLAKGGANEDSNMQLLRPLCNHQKKDKHPIDFMQERGFLL